MNECGLGWKNKIFPEMLKALMRLRVSIPNLKSLKILRWMSALGMEDSTTQLNCVADATAEAYGAVAYLRKCLQGGGTTSHVSRLLAKCHVVSRPTCKKCIDKQESHSDSIPCPELVAGQANGLAKLTKIATMILR